MVGRYICALPSDEELQVFEEKINYSFTNYTLSREALQVSNGFNGDGNKGLALIGDSILDLIIVISGRKKNKTKGEISEMIQLKASNAALAKQGFVLGIDRFIVKNPSQIEIMPKVMATTMEAIVGAVYIDCNEQIQPCEDVMTALGLSWSE
ncbi:hypothetical protein PCG10_004640 [Penicillium crustosum]|uniref:RNase III domain-containing protein n=1 Tax=Penicillium crustosum TaxID=36656 RepID=A0A9P5L5G4_PENCR|nr:hypothetical protein PCG10_004640 [Penicillium crustosum]